MLSAQLASELRLLWRVGQRLPALPAVLCDGEDSEPERPLQQLLSTPKTRNRNNNTRPCPALRQQGGRGALRPAATCACLP